jgi:hypothetical protein
VKRALVVLLVVLGLGTGCSSVKVTSADLERLTNDLAVVASFAETIDTTQLSPAHAHALDDLKRGLQGGVKVGDLLTRVAKANGD